MATDDGSKAPPSGGANLLSPGSATARCARCLETFATVTVFDDHRKDTYIRETPITGHWENRRDECRPIDEFAEDYDLYCEEGVWGTEDWHTAKKALVERLKAGKAKK